MNRPDNKSKSKSSTPAIYRICKDCGQRFPIYGGEQDYAKQNPDKYVLPLRCHKCRKMRRQVEVITCNTCSKTFEMTANEKKFYESKQLVKPKNCPACRNARRASKGEQ